MKEFYNYLPPPISLPPSISVLRERVQQRWGLFTGAITASLGLGLAFWMSEPLMGRYVDEMARPIFKVAGALFTTGTLGIMGWAYGRDPIGRLIADRMYPIGRERLNRS